MAFATQPNQFNSLVPTTVPIGVEIESHIEPVNSEVEPPMNETRYVDRARRIHAACYVREGYIEQSDVDENGFIGSEKDPYSSRSKYFLSPDIEKGHAVAGRQILPVAYPSFTERVRTAPMERKEDKERSYGMMTLPTLREFSCDPDVLLEASGASSLGELEQGGVIEISALAPMEGKLTDSKNMLLTVDLYVKMIRESVQQGDKLWVMGTDRRVTRLLTGMLGEDMMHRLGEGKQYLGSETDPYCLNPSAVVEKFLSTELTGMREKFYAGRLRGGLEGVDITHATPQMKRVLQDAGVDTVKSSTAKERMAKYKPEALAAAGLMGNAALKAAGLTGVEEFNGSVALFSAIDIATVPTYVAGSSMMFRRGGDFLRKKVPGAALAAASFVAPYAYLYANGEDYPPYVHAVVGGMVGISAALGIRRRKQEKDLANALRAEPPVEA